jgi:hypothetical protein
MCGKMLIRIDQFKGTIPKLQTDKLPNPYGQVSINCDLDSGGLAGINQVKFTEALAVGSYGSLFQYNKLTTNFWVAYAEEAYFVKSPLANDQYDRVYISGIEQDISGHPNEGEKDIRVFSNDLIDGGAGTHDQDEDWYTCGVLAGTQPSLADGGGGSGASVTRAVTYTYVTSRGEEGPPAPPQTITVNESDDIDVTFQSLASVGMTADNHYDIEKVRVYFSFRGNTGLDTFNYVGEHTISSESDTGTIDIAANTTPGEALATTDYDPPPDGIDGLIQLPNGWVAGFVGNRIHVCVPYAPYAWPETYTRDLPYPIIGLGAIGTTIVAITTGFPYLVYGNTPDTLRDQKINNYFPGVAGKSIVSARNAVYYAGADGLIKVTQSGAMNATDGFLKKADWDGYVPSVFHSAYFDGAYIAFASVNSDGIAGFVLDENEETFFNLDVEREAVFVAENEAKMYVIQDNAGTPSVYEWRGETLDYLQYRFKSKKFMLPKLVNMSVARVHLDLEEIARLAALIGDNDDIILANDTILTNGGVQRNNPPTTEYTFGGIGDFPWNTYEFNGDPLTSLAAVAASLEVTFNLYADSELIFSKNVSTNKAFKLPKGYKSKRYEVELIGQVPVRSVDMATTMKELAS